MSETKGVYGVNKKEKIKKDATLRVRVPAFLEAELRTSAPGYTMSDIIRKALYEYLLSRRDGRRI